ncbi:ATP-dependent DNA helicase PIF1-like [Papaver somniferum]|uniref:ATP-dependent DNA helicase PIF1-like n=1 Tax=Papaver somniferum TaxID=3469 RepID=UPI000E6F50F8|nr:ATP-dependent DNA helicase PIF1-like [Papaver somniferum]
MPTPKENWGKIFGNRLIFEHKQLQFAIHEPTVQHNIEILNAKQKAAYHAITKSVNDRDGKLFFLNGCEGTGKTFLYNTIATSCRLNGYIVVTVASSGIASLLLAGGRTAHSTFKIPPEINEINVCSISKQKEEAKFFKKVKLIIWDEVPMQHKFCMEAVDRTLKDVFENNLAFGGITVFMGGDFRQTLPIVPNGGREEVLGACVQKSSLWDNMTVLTLDQNKRLDQCQPENIDFAKFLLEVGTKQEEKVVLPSSVNRCGNIKELISKLYPCLGTSQQVSPEQLTERIILSVRNDDLYKINMEALNILKGKTFTYLAADKLNPDESGRIPDYSNENLQNLYRPGMPPFKLDLKVGCPVILMRNLAPSEGLCNGTRLLVAKCRKHVIQGIILTGDKAGEKVLLPRISFKPSASELNVNMTRRQFPVRVAYAMTINKSQGQSVNGEQMNTQEDLSNPGYEAACGDQLCSKLFTVIFSLESGGGDKLL